MEMTVEQKKALALASARKRAAQAGGNAVNGAQAQLPEGESWSPNQPSSQNAMQQAAPVQSFGSLTPKDVTIGDRLFDAAKAIGLPADAMRRDNKSLDAGIRGAADTATFGLSDEISAGLASITGIGGKFGQFDKNLEMQRGIDERDKVINPNARMAGQIAGGVGLGKLMSPYAILSKATQATPILLKALMGGADGAITGVAYGAGSGEGLKGRAFEALKTGGMGAAIGAAFPLISAGAGSAYEKIRNAMAANPIAKAVGASPEALRALGNTMSADGTMGPVGQANMARAGQEAMLADAGPNSQAVLDAAIQSGGKASNIAQSRIGERVARGGDDLVNALDATFGKPEGITATQTGIRVGSAPARSSAYKAAYDAPIDYAHPNGMAIEQIVKTRVPQSAISAANELMRTEGYASKQILAKVADDGSIALETLPDVRQLDYIRRGLNEVADQADGAGKLGGTTAKGRAYQNLSKELRDLMGEIVPEYGNALKTAADPIQRSKAVELGGKLFSPSMTRDQFAEAVQGMTEAERKALGQGVRSQIDDTMARVTRTVQDGGVDARESIKAIKDLSSRANREKLEMAIGKDASDKLFSEVDRIATSFDLRASVAQNSKTYARQATNQLVTDMTEPGIISTAAQGKPLDASKKILQALTGQTKAAQAGKQQDIYAQLADLLTRKDGMKIHDAINKLGVTDDKTKLIKAMIARGLTGPSRSYPSSALLEDRTR